MGLPISCEFRLGKSSVVIYSQLSIPSLSSTYLSPPVNRAVLTTLFKICRSIRSRIDPCHNFPARTFLAIQATSFHLNCPFALFSYFVGELSQCPVFLFPLTIRAKRFYPTTSNLTSVKPIYIMFTLRRTYSEE